MGTVSRILNRIQTTNMLKRQSVLSQDQGYLEVQMTSFGTFPVGSMRIAI